MHIMDSTASSNRKNIRLGIVLSYVNMAVSILASLLVTNVVLDYIGDYNYGLYSFVNSITTWLSVVSSALTASFVRFSSIEKKENDGDTSRTNTIYFKLLMILSIIVIVVGLAILLPMYLTHTNFGNYSWEDSQRIYILFALSLINIAVTMPVTVFSLYISFKQKFIFQRITALLSTLITYGGHLLLAVLTKEIATFAILSIFSTAFFFLLNYAFCRKSLNMTFAKAKLSDNKMLVRSILAFSGILLFNSIVDQINQSVDKTLLGFMASPNDVTIYQLGQNFVNYLFTMSLAISTVFTPTIYEMVVNGDDGINRLYLKVSRIQLLVVTLIAFGFLACGKTFVTVWIGEERITVYYIAAALMLLDICPLSISTSVEIQRARNKHLFRAITYFALALFNVGLSVLFIIIFPIEYAVYACLLGTVITTVCSHWIAMSIYNCKVMKLPIKQYFVYLLKYIVIGGASFGLVFLLDWLFIDNVTNLYGKFFIEGSLFVLFYLLLFIIIEHKLFLEIWGRLKARLGRKRA